MKKDELLDGFKLALKSLKEEFEVVEPVVEPVEEPVVEPVEPVEKYVTKIPKKNSKVKVVKVEHDEKPIEKPIKKTSKEESKEKSKEKSKEEITNKQIYDKIKNIIFDKLNLKELKELAKECQIGGYYKMKKDELLDGFKLALKSFKEEFEVELS